LEALHQYVSDFFEHQGLMDVCATQFDETALLAIGLMCHILADFRNCG
jgi:hypothetical protein